MGKATEVAKRLEALGPREMPVRPELRVRNDAPAVVVNDAPVIKEALDGSAFNQLVLKGNDGTPQAVVLSPERYAELAGSEIQAEQLIHATLEGQIQATPEALGELMVEQVDQAQEWPIGSRRQKQ